MATNTSNMNYHHEPAVELSVLHNKQSLTFHWPSSSGCGDIVSSMLIQQGGHYIGYPFMLLYSHWIIQGKWQKMIHEPLMLVFRIGKQACHLLLELLKMANTITSEGCNYAICWLQKVKDKMSVTLCWCSPYPHPYTHCILNNWIQKFHSDNSQRIHHFNV